MLKTVVIVVVVLIVALLVFAATKPDTFRVQRAARINAPPEKIFALINDFHSWGSWSPFERLGSVTTRTFRGAENGKGAVYEWEGNGDTGAGRMEITASSPTSMVTVKLHLIKPIESHNIVEFTLQAKGDSTNVTWAMHGRNPYFARVMSVFRSMDSMVGKDFETGLARLKTVAEKPTADAMTSPAQLPYAARHFSR